MHEEKKNPLKHRLTLALHAGLDYPILMVGRIAQAGSSNYDWDTAELLVDDLKIERL